MKKRPILLTAVVLCFGWVINSNSTVITVAPGIENLEWLEFSFTQGMSREEVETNLIGSGGFAGYRYATADETAILLDSYYLGDITTVDDGWRLSTATAANSFLYSFGSLGDQQYTPPVEMTSTLDGTATIDLRSYTRFLYGELGMLYGEQRTKYMYVQQGTLQGAPITGYFQETDNSDMVDFYNSAGYSQSIPPVAASLLVRNVINPVPEPTTMLLLGTGLVGLAGVCRIKKK